MVSSAGWTASATANAIEYTSRLDEYKETLSRLFPILPKDSVDAWSISEADILALGLLLDCYPQEVAVLDIGTFVGVSAFFFASHPKVTRVVSVDPNPTVADEINDKSEMLGVQIDSEPLRNLRVLDVARAVLAEFPDENRKVQLHEGTVGTDRIGIQGDSSAGPEKLEEPMSDPMSDLSAEEPLVAFVDGLHTSRGVQADLEAIFEFNPRAVAILDDCRHTWGPFVQAGVVAFHGGRPARVRLPPAWGPQPCYSDQQPGNRLSKSGRRRGAESSDGVRRALYRTARSPAVVAPRGRVNRHREPV